MRVIQSYRVLLKRNDRDTILLFVDYWSNRLFAYNRINFRCLSISMPKIYPEQYVKHIN